MSAALFYATLVGINFPLVKKVVLISDSYHVYFYPSVLKKWIQSEVKGVSLSIHALSLTHVDTP
jgi:hypothetical protein